MTNVALLVGCLGLLCACGGGAPAVAAPRTSEATVPANDAPAQDVPPDGWKRFAYDAHASVLTPAQPEVLPDTEGEGYLASHEGVGYFIACGEVPGEGDGAVDELLAQARETRLRGRPARAERDASRDGMKGAYFETTMTTENGTVLAEHDLVMVRANRVCFLAVMAKEGVDVRDRAARYFGSFRME